jgi:hypothetical protein
VKYSKWLPFFLAIVATSTLCAQNGNPANISQTTVIAMRERNLTAATVVQEIRSGTVIAAASSPNELNDTTPILPLSFMKVYLAASWWEHREPEITFDCQRQNGRTRVTIHEMLVNGCDLPGKEMAIALRRAIGGKAMLTDLHRFGVVTTLRADESDAEWGDTWSLGEHKVSVTVRHISSFLLGVARRRVLHDDAAAKLEAAMRDAVRRGTAQASDTDLNGTGWVIGGKTGSGGVPSGEPLDGLFAGLIFSGSGHPRFTVVTFVRHGGYGGGNAARLSARAARLLVADKN